MSEQMPEQPQNTREQVLNEKRSVIENIYTKLSFIESPEMKELRSHIIDGQGEVSFDILSMWRDRAETMIHSIEDKNVFRKAQIGLLITKTLMYLDANMRDEFYEDIDDAITYASGLGLEDIVEELENL